MSCLYFRSLPGTPGTGHHRGGSIPLHFMLAFIGSDGLRARGYGVFGTRLLTDEPGPKQR